MAITVRTTRKLLLGREISHMLSRAGVTQAEAAKLLETSQARVNNLLNGAGTISRGDLTLLVTKLGITDDGYLDALLELRRDNHKRGYWSTGHNRAYGEDMRLLVDLEGNADLIRSMQSEVIPGLLQCEAYVRAQHAEVSDALGGLSLEDRIQARLARQDILDEPEPPMLQFVLSESCLRRVWGDATVMLEQIEYMITLSKRPNILLQVLPFALPAGRQVPVYNPFTLIRIPSPGVAGPLEVAYVEGAGEIRYLDEKKALATHETHWTRLSNAALRFDETRQFLAKVADDFRGGAPPG